MIDGPSQEQLDRSYNYVVQEGSRRIRRARLLWALAITAGVAIVTLLWGWQL